MKVTKETNTKIKEELTKISEELINSRCSLTISTANLLIAKALEVFNRYRTLGLIPDKEISIRAEINGEGNSIEVLPNNNRTRKLWNKLGITWCISV